MPTVPVQERSIISRTPNVQGVSPGAAAAPYEAVERAGYRMQQLGDTITDFAAAQKRAEQALELSTAKIDLDTAIDEHLGTYDADNDYKNYPAKYGDFAQKTAEAFEKRVSPEVWKVLEPTVRNRLNQTRVKVDYHGRKLFIQDGLATVDRNFNEATKQYAYLTDPGDRQLKRAQIELDLGGAVAAGFIRPDQQVKLMEGLDNKADLFSSEMLIQQNPEVAYTALSKRNESGQFAAYPNLTPEQRAQRIKEAESASWTKFARLEKQERELQEDTKLKLYNLLEEVEKGKVKPGAFEAEIDRATQRDTVTGIRALTPDAGQHMKRELKALLKGEGAEDKNRDATVYSGYLDKIVAGPLTAEDKGKIERDGRLRYEEKKELLRAAAGAERKEDTAEKTAKKEYARFVGASIFKEIDAKFPNTGKTKEINASLKAVIHANQKAYGDDTDAFKDWAVNLIDWSKKESTGLFASKGAVRDSLQKMLTPAQQSGPTVVESRRAADGSIMEKMSDGTIRKR